MKVSNSIGLKGYINLKVIDKDGNVRHEHSQQNLVVNEGLEIMAAKIFDKKSATFTNLFPGDVSTSVSTDPVNFHIAEIAIGTSGSPAIVGDTYASLMAKHGNAALTRFKTTKKLIKSINNQKIDSVLPENSFYFQANFGSVSSDTLKDSPLGTEVPIRELMLIAKNGDYTSPAASAIDPRKIMCRTVLTQPFTKYVTDSIAMTWKLQIG